MHFYILELTSFNIIESLRTLDWYSNQGLKKYIAIKFIGDLIGYHNCDTVRNEDTGS